MSALSLLQMIQISDSLFPIGAFTLSNGLETMVLQEKLTTKEDLDRYVKNYMKLLPFNNLGIIYDSEKNVFREAPVFDNGAGLLSNVSKFPVFRSIEENSENIAGQPICANLDLQAYYAGITLQIDYEMFENLYIQTLKPSRALLVLKYQLQQKRKIFPDLKKISLK